MPTLDLKGGAARAARAARHAPRFNADGVSVHGCTTIYAPKGQAGEYSALAVNLYKGCGHKCAYCYVPLVTHQDRAEFDAGAVLLSSKARPDILAALDRDAQRYAALGSQTQIMFSFTTDPFHPFDTSATRTALETLRRHGLPFCTLTKGGSRALRDLDLFRPECDAFASTLTSLDSRFSKKWERGAADPADRIATLAAFNSGGIFTWVSLEPTLDVDASLALVDATHHCVDLYKVGRANYLKEITRTTDWADYTRRMIVRLAQVRRPAYIKQDLQPYLPVDYPNPLRIAQNNSAAAKRERKNLAGAQAAAVAHDPAAGVL